MRQRGPQGSGFERKGVEAIGESGLKIFLWVASRHYRGIGSTIRGAAKMLGVNLSSAAGCIDRLIKIGLLQKDALKHSTLSPTDRFQLDFVEWPRCLTRHMIEIANHPAAQKFSRPTVGNRTPNRRKAG